MCVCVCVCGGGGGGGGGGKVLCVWGGGGAGNKIVFRRGVGSGSAAKGGPTEKVGIPYL